MASVWKMKVYGGTFNGEYPGLDGSEYVMDDLDKLNIAGITCRVLNGPIPVGTFVTINSWDGSTNREMFCGWIKKYTLVTKATNNYFVHKYELVEYAGVLEQVRVHTTTPTDFTVDCPAGDLGEALTVILNDTGWDWDTACSSATPLPAMQFYWTTVMAALKKVILEMGSESGTSPFKMWFDATGAATGSPEVGWGTYRTDLTAWNFTAASYYQYEDQKNNNKKEVDGVVVMGQNNAWEGQYPTPFTGTGTKLAVYSYPSAISNSECTTIATRLYTDYMKDPEHRIEFKIRPEWAKVGTTYIQEGDLIKVDGTNYVVMDMYKTPKDVIVGLNAGQVTFQSIYGDQLTAVDGDIRPYNQSEWHGEWQNIPPAGQVAEYIIDIADVDAINTFMLAASVMAYRTNVTVGASTGLLSDVDQVITSTTAADDSTGTATNFYVPNSSGLALPQLANGHQYGLVQVTGWIARSTYGTLRFTVQRDLGAGFSDLNSVYFTSKDTADYFPFSVVILVSGSTTAETGATECKYRIYVTTETAATQKHYGVYTDISRVTRHLHSQVATVQRTTDPALPAATNLGFTVNGAAHTAAMPLTPTDITAHLITGKNTICFYYNAAGYGAVKPYATYQVAGY